MKGAPRKLRKSCSLPTCSKTPGECMHCTCDGRCGQHAGGRCGVRREGNGKSCKREGCLRDETCLHSTRATCCHCRNLVSSSNRTSRKRTRTEASVSVVLNTTPVVTVAVTASQTAVLKMEEMEEMKQHIEAAHGGGEDKTKAKTEGEEDDGAASPTSCDALLPLSADLFVDFEICEELLVVTKKPRTEALTMEDLDELKDDKLLDVEQFITPSITLQTEEQEQKMEEEDDEDHEEEEDDEVVVLTPKSLSEYEAYAARRAACNLVVVVEGVQFNLHKHPMLLESQLLNAKARESVLTTPSPVPVIRLPVFPGGVEAFEALCVYAYTGELPLSVDNVASLFCAVQFLNMGFAVASKTRDFLSSITSQPSVEPLLRVTQDAQALMTKHDSLQVCQQLQLECVDALARAMPLESAAVGQLLSLPIELFLQVTQEMLATRGPQDLAMDTVRQLVVQAELAQLHRTALDAETEKQDEKKTEAVQQSLALLQRSLKGDAADEEFRSTGRLAAAVGDAATPDDEDDALFMKMMGEFEMDSTSEDELLGDGPVVSSSGFIDPLSFEPFAFSSRRESSHHRMLSSAFAV